MAEAVDREAAWTALKQGFEATELQEVKPFTGDPKIFDNLEQVENWGRHAKTTLSQAAKEHRSNWVAQEVDKVWMERQTMAPELKPPLQQKSLQQEAHERVDARIQRGFALIDRHILTERQRFTGAPEQAQSPALRERQPAHPLKKQTHASIDDVAEKVKTVFLQYEHNRSALIEQYTRDGVPDPYSAFDQAREDACQDAIKQTHKDIHRSFIKHGIDRAPAHIQVQSGSMPDG